MNHTNTAKNFLANNASVMVAKGAGLSAVVIIGLALAGCGSIGMPGYQEYVDGQYDEAYASFVTDYKDHPNSAIAQVNMGGSYLQRGDHAQANVYFHEAAQSGKDVRPDGMTEPHDASTTIADVACRHLHADGQSDANCPTERRVSAE